MQLKLTDIDIRPGSNRNTPCTVVDLGDLRLYVSYQTIVGFLRIRDGEPIKARRTNDWGPTTGRHMADMGIKDWPQLDAEAFEAAFNEAAAL